MKLIVGLGNPGTGYSTNRHNVGFRCIDYFARLNRIPLTQRWHRAKVGTGTVAGVDIVLAKPQTFMNLSGAAVSSLVHRLKLPLDDLLVIQDDMDLPPGKVRIRPRGSSGGHRGTQSIIDALGSQDFPRIRVGIGRPIGDEISYVLSDFLPEERPVIEEAIATVSDAIYYILTEGIEAAMNEYN